MRLTTRSQVAVAAEVLFLRKQLAFYQERTIKPRRFDDAARLVTAASIDAFRLEECSGQRKTGDVDRLAPEGLPPFLELEIAGRKTTPAAKPSRTDRGDGPE